jgi:2,3-bisphosphoglycerate-dependent phosphoglycerate mutase
MENFRTLTLPDDLDETGWWNRPFEAEEDRQPRADQVFADLLARHLDAEGQPEARVALVSHGGFFMRLLSAVLMLPWRQAAHGLKSWFLLNNCSVSRFDIRADEITVAYINRTDFLPDHLIT